MIARFVVSGLVQGVGYRAFARRAATELGLAGFARNARDGTVETVVSGPPDLISRYEETLRRGPVLSRVLSVIRSEILDQTQLPNSFEIR